jgi:uncharacterized 2Fe-2S/4Fe-4S cluster protein (DUF4445 family)
MVSVIFQPYGRRAQAMPGESLLDVARRAGVDIRSVCGGKGSCGKCKLVLRKGEVNFGPAPPEELLTADEISRGYVIACITRCKSDCEVLVPPESRIGGQKILSEAALPKISIEPALAKRGFGLAFDVGTTKVTAYLVDMETGKIVGVESDYNRQLAYGEDLVSRIGYAAEKDGVENMRKAVVETMNGLIRSLVSKQGIETGSITDVCVAGNTVMTYLFLGRDPTPLLDPDARVVREQTLTSAKSVGLHVNHVAEVYCLPCVSRFLGGDAVGDILLSGMCETDEISLLLDIGTNVEAVFGSRGWLLSTTAAAGPAFEGWGIKFGMRSVEGAIEHVKVDQKTLKARYTVIGNAKPRGICGSGLIDLMAELFRNGVLDSLGRLSQKPDSPYLRTGSEGREYIVASAPETEIETDIVITEKDILNLIDSKAAACSTVGVMMKKLNLSVDDVAKVYVCGAFASYMDLNSAMAIGLLPEFPKAEIKFLGNGSVAGAYLTLVSKEYRKRASKIAGLMTCFDLLKDADFMDEYTAAYMLPGKRELFPTWWERSRESRANL